MRMPCFSTPLHTSALAPLQRFLDAYLHGVQGTAFDVAVTHEVNAGELLAFVAMYSVLKSKIDTVQLSRVDFAVISACAMFFLFPKQSLPFVVATIAGLYSGAAVPTMRNLHQQGSFGWRFLFQILGPSVFSNRFRAGHPSGGLRHCETRPTARIRS